ncbi:MAG: disulfide bond formation protein B [Asticcacaulis sp.]
MTLFQSVGRWWAFYALAAATAMLAAAHGFEHFMNLPPCALCLKQRDVYWLAIGVSAIASAWALFSQSRGTPRVASYLLFAIFATGAIVATFHAGVELKWWPGPSTCTTAGTDAVSIDAIASLLAGKTVKPPMCDIVPWTFLGISMAGWNAVVSGLLALASLLSSLRRKGKPGVVLTASA